MQIAGTDKIPRYEYRTKIDSKRPKNVFGFVRKVENDTEYVFLFTDRVGLLENELNITKGHLVKILFNQKLLSLDSDGKKTKPTKLPWKLATVDRPRMHVISLDDLKLAATTEIND